MHDTIKILLVDDEQRNLDALEAILDDPSYALLRAQDADAALKLLLEHDVAVIVLDIKMPGVNGIELAQLIKGTKKFRLVPIVFLTAYLVDEQDVVMGYGAGAVDYITKPVNPVILRHKVAVFADLFRKTRALAELNEQLESRVRERTAELEHAARMKDEFLATLSHELRTPLHAMLGWAAILRSDSRDRDKVQRGLEVIYRNAKSQERLVTDLLDVSRIISGKLRLDMTKFALAEAIQAAVDVVRPAAEAKRLRLSVDLNPSIGVVVGDPDRLQQVAWNLLVNAIRFTPEGGRITVAAAREGSVNVLRVEDDGVGIAADHLPHMFVRFGQIDSSTTRAHGGLGLGLALVRHLVEAHGGAVEARSDGIGRGATFIVSLPVLAVHVADGAPAPANGEEAMAPQAGSTPPKGETPRELANVRVLVMEDDPDSLELVRFVLEEAGASVTGLTSAHSATDALDAEPFDVIVSDLGMPDLDGYAAMRRIRAAGHRRVPAIALSAYARGEDVERARSAGYQEHLAKPVDGWKLVEMVKSLVRDRSLDRSSTAPALPDGSRHPLAIDQS